MHAWVKNSFVVRNGWSVNSRNKQIFLTSSYGFFLLFMDGKCLMQTDLITLISHAPIATKN